MPVSFERALRICALVATAVVVAMVALYIATGVGQDPLQFVHPPAEYAQLLRANPTALRATIGLDNVFIVLYSAFFVALAAILRRDRRPQPFLTAASALLAAVALLDFVENFHFMVMLAAVEQGATPTRGEIEFQVFESLLKFHVSYLGLFCLGLALPRQTASQRWMANLSIFVQLPVGVLIYVAPRAVAVPLVFVRFIYFVAGQLLCVRAFARPRAADDSDARASHPDTTPVVAG